MARPNRFKAAAAALEDDQVTTQVQAQEEEKKLTAEPVEETKPEVVVQPVVEEEPVQTTNLYEKYAQTMPKKQVKSEKIMLLVPAETKAELAGMVQRGEIKSMNDLCNNLIEEFLDQYWEKKAAGEDKEIQE